MAFRFSQQPPKTLDELFRRILELLPQLEPKVLHDVTIDTTTTKVAHGLGYAPSIVIPSAPNCLALICQDQQADMRNLYLRASNLCVCDVRIK